MSKELLDFFVTGKLILEIDIDDIEAYSVEEAEAEAREILEDFYKLKSSPYHKTTFKLDLHGEEYTDDK